ncbi:carbonic anhydrase family protein, partial [Salmonella sp. s51228]|uniref:carbonic anhydrase family protein n=1 Tax=Salmonella sp. s51228 TaxID=3159652 RepID=UPI00398019BF
FHWGSKAGQGQEHVINERTGVGELHLVYYNYIYKNLSSAVSYNAATGLVVFSYILDVCKSDLDSIFGVYGSIIDQVKYYGSTTVSYKIRLDAISNPCFSSNCKTYNQYYVYDGSLTTPECNQIVTWFVSANNLCISQTQLNKLRGTKDKVGSPLVNNYRNTQYLNCRTIHITTSKSDLSELQPPLSLSDESTLSV